MPFSFPSNPSVNDTSSQNGRLYQWNGYAWDLVGNVAAHASSHSSSGADPVTLTSSQISNFNSSVSGLLPTITNSGDNKVLTSTGSTVGITAESNLTFDGSLLSITGSGLFASGLNISNQTASTIASFDSNKNISSLSTSTYPTLTELSYVKNVTSAVQTQLNNKASSTHTHTASDITNFNSSVSGLININITNASNLYLWSNFR